MGNEIDHIQARHPLLVQVVHSVRVFFAKNGHQHIGTIDFFLAIACGLHMHDGALNDTLEPQSGLGVHIIRTGHLGGVFLDEIGQRFAQIVNVGGTGPQHLGGARVVQQGKQQVLDRDEFMALLASLYKGQVQTDFEFLGNHELFLD